MHVNWSSLFISGVCYSLYIIIHTEHYKGQLDKWPQRLISFGSKAMNAVACILNACELVRFVICGACYSLPCALLKVVGSFHQILPYIKG